MKDNLTTDERQATPQALIAKDREKRPKSYGDGTPSLGVDRRAAILMQIQEAADTATERGGYKTVVHPREGGETLVPLAITSRQQRRSEARRTKRRARDVLMPEVVGRTVSNPNMGEIGCCTKAINRPGFMASPGRVQQIKNERKRERRARG